MDLAVLEEYQQFAVQLAKQSGQIIVESMKQDTLHVETKSSRRDLVTEIDKKVEKFIFDSLKERYPNHCFIGEESVGTSKVLNTDEPTWIVDPIDGTMNFVHRSPFCCVSIGLAIKQTLVLGVIYAPFFDKLYSAIKGQGAMCNGNRIKVSSGTEDVENSLVLCEVKYGHPNPKKSQFTEKIYNSLLWKCQGIRSLGTACISLCFVADGSVDVFFHDKLCIWDIAAGYVIVTEAGGTVLQQNGDTFDPNVGNVLATSNPTLAEHVSKYIRDATQ